MGLQPASEQSFRRAAEVASEVDRYCSWPGQACGYKVGHSTINRLRDQERQRLGAKFSLCEFHDKLLSAGSISLPLVEQRYFNY